MSIFQSPVTPSFFSMMAVSSSSNTSSCLVCNSSITNSSYLVTQLTSWQITATVIIVGSCLVGIPANLTILVKLSQRLHGSSMTQRLLFSLAMSDLLCLLCPPIGGVIFFYGPPFADGACQFFFFFFVFCIISDLNNLLLISIQRYYQVLHNDQWSRVVRTWQRVIFFSVWMLGALVALPAVFLITDREKMDEQNDSLCKNKRIAPVLQAVYIILTVFIYLIMLFYYLRLVRGVNRNQMPDQRQNNLTKVFIRIVTAALAVAFPPLVARAMYVIGLFTGSDLLISINKKMTFVECIYFLNHCLNPFLYFFSSSYLMRGGSNPQSERYRVLLKRNT